jgi:drug/metabolite transporter (DMT)-like permease
MPPANFSRRAALSANLQGILWMLLTAFLLTGTAAISKYLGRTLPVIEIVFFRMILGALIMLPWLLRHGLKGLATQRLATHFWRAILGVGAFVLYIYAVSNMLLANAVALAFSTPLWMIVMSHLMLGTRSGPARTIATFVGFIGILVIARPDVEISPPALAALASAFLLSLAMIYVKRLSATESTAKIAFYVQFFGALFTLPPAILAWQDPAPMEWAWLIGVGVVGAVGQVTQARAYGIGTPTAITPVDFTRLPIAVILGMIFFGEMPDAWAFAGMVLIAGSILFISHRERRLGAATTAAKP